MWLENRVLLKIIFKGTNGRAKRGVDGKPVQEIMTDISSVAQSK
jgi:hypothetical protein